MCGLFGYTGRREAGQVLIDGIRRLEYRGYDSAGVVAAARLGSPLVVGIGSDGTYLASDPNALAGYADKVVYLSDRQLCRITETDWVIRDAEFVPVSPPVHDIGQFLGDGDAERG